MKGFLFHILFVFINLSAFSQELFIEKPAKYITHVPFKQLTGGIILLKANINNISDTFNFILDTGSGGISLDSSTCAEHKIYHSPSGKTINGIAGIKEVDFAKNNTLTFPKLSLKGLDFYVNDYEILTSVYGIKIDGIIGYSFFSKYIVKINFDSSDIEVYQPGSIRYPSGGYLLHPLFTALPIQSLRIKDAKTVTSNFYIDTGAGLSFLLSKDFITDSSFIKKTRVPVKVEAQGLGGRKNMMMTIIKEVKLGPYIFRRVPTHILDDEFNVTSYPYLGGLIGNDILRRFNIILNYQKREIHLLPNSHYKEAFDYSYTGLTIYNIDGKITVDDVVPGSPAYKSGIKKNDIIFSVNNNLSGDINIYKNLLQAEGERVKIIIMRDGHLTTITLKVGKIF
ncbi:MAG: aspartyl protease family protein [Bacteroidota bacterium]|nr:aspartyl protease family protein [Bacteroidota bacterium]